MDAVKKNNISRLLALAVAFAGLLVIIGWIFDINVLKSIIPSWISMKFDTAVSFVLSGVNLYYIGRAKEGEFEKAQVALSISTLILLLLMGVLFFSSLFGIRTGVEDLFVKEAAGAVKSVFPGRPSVPTMLNFLLIALAGILTIMNADGMRAKHKTIGLTMAAIGSLAVFGYVINIPILYYYVEGLNSAMACHTAVLFVLLGTGLACL